MSHDEVDAWTNLAREDLDPDCFARAVAVQHIRQVIVHGGRKAGVVEARGSGAPFR